MQSSPIRSRPPASRVCGRKGSAAAGASRTATVAERDESRGFPLAAVVARREFAAGTKTARMSSARLDVERGQAAHPRRSGMRWKREMVPWSSGAPTERRLRLNWLADESRSAILAIPGGIHLSAPRKPMLKNVRGSCRKDHKHQRHHCQRPLCRDDVFQCIEKLQSLAFQSPLVRLYRPTASRAWHFTGLPAFGAAHVVQPTQLPPEGRQPR